MTRQEAEEKLRTAIRERKLFHAAVCWGALERLNGFSVRFPVAEDNPLAVVQ
jgi:hypothetical protein